MDIATVSLLAVSVISATARAVFSKKLGADHTDKYSFYIMQAILFAVAMAVIFLVNIKNITIPSATALLLAFFYGVLATGSSWNYTAAISKTPVSVCTMVYSFGFIIPTVLGTVLWREEINALKIISIALCVAAIVLTALDRDKGKFNLRALPVSLIIAMLSSGGLGLVQKVQQKSVTHNETGVFLVCAFAFATVFSLTAARLKQGKDIKKAPVDRRLWLNIAIVGAAMALGNTVNTILVGLLPSAVVFPVVNVGAILSSLAVSAVALKEKISKWQMAAFILGITAILLFNL